MVEKIPSPDVGVPVRTAVYVLLSVSAASGLVSESELGGLITRFADPTLETENFRTILDTFVLSYAANILLSQAGIIKESPTASKV